MEKEIKVSEPLIAFQTVDNEGDIWCNEAFVFKSQAAANKFFSNPKLVIDTLGFELEEGESVEDCCELFKSSNGDVDGVNINLKYCGFKAIRSMSKGFYIE